MIGLATKKDFALVSIVGTVFGLFLIPILENIKPPQWELNIFTASTLIIGFFLFANFALAIGGMIGKKFPAFWQFTKFGASGALNAALDIGLLNLLSLIFQIFSGPLLAIFNAISLFVAFNNSYLWNKLWVFKLDGKIDFKEYLKFAGATGVGMVIGSLIVYLITTFVTPPAGISPQIWENIAKGISLPLVVFSNFTLYKFVVFKRPPLNF